MFPLTPSSPATRARMQTQRRRDTRPELALRQELHRRGRRFFVDRAPLRGVRRRADLVFPRHRLAVFVDGCFWHACPEHGRVPRSNVDWWRKKLAGNAARDRDTDEQLAAEGWRVVRVWEHEPLDAAAGRVEIALGPRPPVQTR
ncbi:very short patch repair endonuclease [Geodermatophilus sp. CPCC 206100]|uniref:very short patch repair endonuclease n=1 Tax=Geodermatophilus sp. CPCC 206100 TaxID=3020054 RepID=UPI003B00944D